MLFFFLIPIVGMLAVILVLVVMIAKGFFKTDSSSLNLNDTNALQAKVDNSKEVLETHIANLNQQLQSQKQELSQLIFDFKASSTSQDQAFVAKITSLDANLNHFKDNFNKQDSDLKQSLLQQNQQLGTSFENVIKDLTEIKGNAKTLMSLDENVRSLQNVFLNSKQRGNLGEFLLATILQDTFGQNTQLWEVQKKLPSSEIVDAFLNFPNSKAGIAIDSKFPFTNYNKHLQEKDRIIQDKYLAEFKKDLKKRVDEVAKYISPTNGITSAIMFIPSEDVFAYIYGQFPDDVIRYAFKKHVWITSPTTLSAMLFVIQRHSEEVDLNKNIAVIKSNIIKLQQEFNRWIKRWEDFKTIINKLPDKVNQLDQTHQKITHQYDKNFQSPVIDHQPIASKGSQLETIELAKSPN